MSDHYDDYERDDRCDDEQREADIWNRAEEQCERLGIPFDEVLSDVGNDLRGRGK